MLLRPCSFFLHHHWSALGVALINVINGGHRWSRLGQGSGRKEWWTPLRWSSPEGRRPRRRRGSCLCSSCRKVKHSPASSYSSHRQLWVVVCFLAPPIFAHCHRSIFALTATASRSRWGVHGVEASAQRRWLVVASHDSNGGDKVLCGERHNEALRHDIMVGDVLRRKWEWI